MIEQILGRSSLAHTGSVSLQAVLERIERGSPEDLARIAACIHCIRPLTNDEAADGTLGEVHRHAEPPFAGWSLGVDWLCDVTIFEGAANLPVIIAHELGHVATTDEDLATQQVPDDEWGHECAANRYVYNWGFDAELKEFWKTADRRHHGHPPGSWYEMRNQRFEVGEDYIIRRID